MEHMTGFGSEKNETFIEQRSGGVSPPLSKKKGGCANCMWTRQVMRDEGFTNGQIRYAVIKLALRVQKASEPNAWARTFDAWVLPKNKE